MSKIIELEINLPDGTTATYVSIPNGDGVSTMLKSIYDELKANEAETI
jgi:hypothetical protein